MTNKEKQIRAEWIKFKSTHSKQQGRIYLEKDKIDSVLSKIFG